MKLLTFLLAVFMVIADVLLSVLLLSTVIKDMNSLRGGRQAQDDACSPLPVMFK
jgi:hypothetical protein